MPSRSRSSPAPRLSSGTVKGWTNSSVRSVHATVRRTSPSGSPCTVVAGPTGTTPRRRVGTTNSSSWARPAPSEGRANRAAVSPTGSSTSSGSSPRREVLVTSIRPVAGSPTVTRVGSTSTRMRTRARPDREREAGQHQHQARHGDHRQLDPGVAGGEPPRHQPDAEHGPAERRDPPQHLEHRVPDRPGRLGDRPDPAAGEHEDARAGLGERGRHLNARQRGRAGARVARQRSRLRMPCRAVAAPARRSAVRRRPAAAPDASRRAGAAPASGPEPARNDARVTVAPSSAGDDGAAAGARSERRVVDPTSSRGSVMTRGAPWVVPPRRGSG